MEGEDEATKVDARQFMTDVLPTNGDNVVADGSVVGVADMRAWKSTYATAITAIATAAAAAENNGDDTATTTDAEVLMETFWSTYYNPETTSIWTMKYDEVDSTDDLKEAIGIVDTFMMNPGMILEKEDTNDDTKSNSNMTTMKEYCFGVMHTYDNLDIEGLWFFNGLDPEELFGANEETSWYTWTQVGPEANEHVKTVVANYLTPDKKKVDDNNRAIKDTKVFC